MSQRLRYYCRHCGFPQPTGRQNEALQLAAEGFTNEQIARRMSLATSTVKNLIYELCSITGCSSRTQLVIHAYQHGMVVPPEPHDDWRDADEHRQQDATVRRYRRANRPTIVGVAGPKQR
jgi:DNA-binding CsgD family transcriptional regulator